MLLETRVHVEKDHALLLQIFPHGMVHRLGLILCAHPGKEFPLGLGNPKAVERFLDFSRDLIPRRAWLLRGLQVVIDIGELDAVQQRRVRPDRHRFRQEGAIPLQAQVQHPRRLPFHAGDLPDLLLVQTGLRLKDRVLRHVEAVELLVLVVDGDLGLGNCHRPSSVTRPPASPSPDRGTSRSLSLRAHGPTRDHRISPRGR